MYYFKKQPSIYIYIYMQDVGILLQNGYKILGRKVYEYPIKGTNFEIVGNHIEITFGIIDSPDN